MELKSFILRNRTVFLDSDIAAFYQVSLKSLRRAIQKNIKRFPERLMLRLLPQETQRLKIKRKSPVYVFTGQGAAMVSTVLSSKKAIEANVHIIRTVVQMTHSSEHIGECAEIWMPIWEKIYKTERGQAG